MKLANKLEAVLFFKNEPISKKKLSDILGITEEEVINTANGLKEILSERGVVLIDNNGEYSLGTAPEYSKFIEDLQKEELNKSLSKATLETLSIVLYKNGASRAEIDYIRGVNSSFTLRALSVRGLVEKVPDPADARKYLYKPTIELLSFMGITSVNELPEFTLLEEKIKLLATSSVQEATDTKDDQK